MLVSGPGTAATVRPPRLKGRRPQDHAKGAGLRLKNGDVTFGSLTATRTSDLTFAYIESYQPNFTRSAAQPPGTRPISPQAQRATERSARNAETIMYSATAIAKGMNRVSREYFEFVRQQIERSMDRMNELWRCRTPHDLAAVQTDLVRDTIRSAMDSSRRMADMSLKVADDAGNHIAQSVERMQRAA